MRRRVKEKATGNECEVFSVDAAEMVASGAYVFAGEDTAPAAQEPVAEAAQDESARPRKR